MSEICPDIALISETWERKNFRLDQLLSVNPYKVLSYYRKERSGGGCAMFYNENRFRVKEEDDMSIPNGVEVKWAILTPVASTKQSRVKKIAVCTIYVAPNSQFKNETIDHIIEATHLIKTKYNNEINFLMGGDLNHLDIKQILDSNGLMKQIVTVPTRKSATLEMILTDMHSFYHPPTTFAPLQVDADQKGKDSDHEIIVMAPLSNDAFRVKKDLKRYIYTPSPSTKYT